MVTSSLQGVIMLNAPGITFPSVSYELAA